MAFATLRTAASRRLALALQHPKTSKLTLTASTSFTALLAQQRCFSSAAPDSTHTSPSTDKKYPAALLTEMNYLASPEKANGRGEDSYFVSRYAIGVADGVGGWSEQGIDSSVYSQGLMDAAKEYVEQEVEKTAAAGAAGVQGQDSSSSGSSATGKILIDPLKVIHYAHAQTNVLGSSTVTLGTVDHESKLHVGHVGDSGIMVWRHSKVVSLGPPVPLRLEEAAKLWSLQYKSKEQQHYFNCPFQLAMPRHGDQPKVAVKDTVEVKAGDIVIAATDGLWDNLFLEEVQGYLARVDFTPCHDYVRVKRRRYNEQRQAVLKELLGEEQARERAAEGAAAAAGGETAEQKAAREKRAEIAAEDAKQRRAAALQSRAILNVADNPVTGTELAEREKACKVILRYIASTLSLHSQRVGKDSKAKSPFSVNAARHGLRFEGGKLDDVMVVVGMVVPDEAAVEADARDSIRVLLQKGRRASDISVVTAGEEAQLSVAPSK